MKRALIQAISGMATVAATTICALGAQPPSKPETETAAVGPRGPVGPNVSLSETERTRLANTTTVLAVAP